MIDTMKNFTRILILSCLISAGAGRSAAQQDVLLSQYMFNHMLINPAYAGNKDYTVSQLLYRRQWVGMEGAPETQIGSVHGRVGTKNLGWGALIGHDRIGATDRTDAYANGAYHLQVKEGMLLSLGLRAGGSFFACNNTDLRYWDDGDMVFDRNRVSRFLPNVGTGLYLYTSKYYAGLSVPTVISYDQNQSLSSSSAAESYVPRQVRHYYATGGMVFKASRDVVLKPSVLLKYVAGAPLQADINMNVLLSDILWVGASYRTGDALVGLLEFQVNKRLRFGYSYDYTLSDIRDYSSGSHEIMVGYDFGKSLEMKKGPTYF
ncbi:MAG: hypothetical protein RL213_1886 [Bacteroidota bacterium]